MPSRRRVRALVHVAQIREAKGDKFVNKHSRPTWIDHHQIPIKMPHHWRYIKLANSTRVILIGRPPFEGTITIVKAEKWSPKVSQPGSEDWKRPTTKQNSMPNSMRVS